MPAELINLDSFDTAKEEIMLSHLIDHCITTNPDRRAIAEAERRIEAAQDQGEEIATLTTFDDLDYSTDDRNGEPVLEFRLGLKVGGDDIPTEFITKLLEQCGRVMDRAGTRTVRWKSGTRSFTGEFIVRETR